jgi:hypothetical protein
MSSEGRASIRILTAASQFRCDRCPPERVCAWGCLQGAGIEEIVIGAALVLENAPGPAWTDQGLLPSQEALWDSFNSHGDHLG